MGEFCIEKSISNKQVPAHRNLYRWLGYVQRSFIYMPPKGVMSVQIATTTRRTKLVFIYFVLILRSEIIGVIWTLIFRHIVALRVSFLCCVIVWNVSKLLLTDFFLLLLFSSWLRSLADNIFSNKCIRLYISLYICHWKSLNVSEFNGLDTSLLILN